MTSGNFSTVPIGFIWVNRETRQRKDLINIEELASSIHRVGLINPPTIKRDGELIAGERRYTAMKMLGWTDIPVQYIEDLSDEELKKVEFEENLRRSDITWQDRCKAVKEYHEIRVREDPNWTQYDTGTALGITQAAVSSFMDVAKEVLAGNKLVTEAPKMSAAVNITMRKKEREKTATLAALLPQAPEARKAPLLLADFSAWVPSYSGPKFNLIHCDFPYGINFQDAAQASDEFTAYADTPEIYFSLLSTLERAMHNVVHESAHLVFWFSMDYYEETKTILDAMGWRVNPFPLIWHKSDNTGILPDPNRGPRRIYETAFLASRGDRKIVRAVSNLFSFAGQGKELHRNEKPVPMLSHFLGMLTDEYTTFLDPTCGSANAVKAAKKLGAADALGLEISEEFFTIASAHFFD